MIFRFCAIPFLKELTVIQSTVQKLNDYVIQTLSRIRRLVGVPAARGFEIWIFEFLWMERNTKKAFWINHGAPTTSFVLETSEWAVNDALMMVMHF